MPQFELSADAHHYLGIEMNQQVWALLGKETRDDKDNRRMEHFALASLHHWQNSPSYQPLNAQRGHWLVSRAYAVLGRGEQALGHAGQCMALTVELDLQGFDRAYAHEAMARAHAATGNRSEAAAHYEKATTASGAITGPEDKKLFLSDLQGPPWFSLSLGGPDGH